MTAKSSAALGHIYSLLSGYSITVIISTENNNNILLSHMTQESLIFMNIYSNVIKLYKHHINHILITRFMNIYD